jgi:putative nucleotidyltransferase with HDIG domain
VNGILPLRRNKFINDNIYGGIGFTNKEFEIINTKTFQRLRRIKQQGLTNFTFPSADHTRFSHSLGVLHIMGKMTDWLAELDAIGEKDRKLLRYAALLHDVGHYPLSHATEEIYRMRDVISNPPILSPLCRFGDPDEKKSKKPHHEYLGVEVLKRRKDIRLLLKDDGFEPEQIGEIITGQTRNQMYRQLMHSSFDADRLDYLLRDSASAGVHYGLIDLDYLIRLLLPAEEKFNFVNREEIHNVLGINIKGVHALEHYLMARYFSYSQLTFHKTTAVFENLAKAIIWYLAEEGKIYRNYEEIKKIVGTKEFLGFDDSYIWSKIGKKSSFSNNLYFEYREALIERQKIKVLYEVKEIRKKGTQNINENYTKLSNKAKEELNFFAGILEIPVEKIGYIEKRLSVEKSQAEIDDDPDAYREAARVVRENKAQLLVKSESSLIKETFDRELCILRIFYIDPYPYDNDASDDLVRLAREKISAELHLE